MAKTDAAKRKSAPPLRFLDRADLRKRGIKYHRSWLNDLMEAGKFPRCVRLNDSKFARRMWVEAEIEKWQRQKMAERFAKSGEAA